MLRKKGSEEERPLGFKNEVEALLFSSGKNMTVDNVATIIGIERKDVLAALKTLQEEYNGRDSALMIMDEGDMWKIHVREKFLPLVRRIVSDTELPKSVLETLAIIAYKSPVLQSEVIDTRSSVAYEHIGLLMDMGFIMREKKGRSFALRVTEKFFDYFDISGDKTLKDMFKNIPIKVTRTMDQEKEMQQDLLAPPSVTSTTIAEGVTNAVRAEVELPADIQVQEVQHDTFGDVPIEKTPDALPVKQEKKQSKPKAVKEAKSPIVEEKPTIEKELKVKATEKIKQTKDTKVSAVKTKEPETQTIAPEKTKESAVQSDVPEKEIDGSSEDQNKKDEEEDVSGLLSRLDKDIEEIEKSRKNRQ